MEFSRISSHADVKRKTTKTQTFTHTATSERLLATDTAQLTPTAHRNSGFRTVPAADGEIQIEALTIRIEGLGHG